MLLNLDHKTMQITDGNGSEVPLDIAKELYATGHVTEGNAAMDLLIRTGFNIKITEDCFRGW